MQDSAVPTVMPPLLQQAHSSTSSKQDTSTPYDLVPQQGLDLVHHRGNAGQGLRLGPGVGGDPQLRCRWAWHRGPGWGCGREFIKSRSRASAADSPMPKVFTVRETITPSESRFQVGDGPVAEHRSHTPGAGRGASARGCRRPPWRTPGAVPQSLSRTVAPSGIMACWKLFSVTGRPMAANRSRIRWAEGSWYTRVRPKAWATATLVRSSQVGPSPPVVMMNVRPLAGNVHCLADPLRVVPHHGVIVDVDPQLGQSLGDHLGIGVGNVAQEKLRAHGDEFSGVAHGCSTTLSMPCIAVSIRPSISRAASASWISSREGRVLGWRGVKTVQQSS